MREGLLHPLPTGRTARYLLQNAFRVWPSASILFSLINHGFGDLETIPRHS